MYHPSFMQLVKSMINATMYNDYTLALGVRRLGLDISVDWRANWDEGVRLHRTLEAAARDEWPPEDEPPQEQWVHTEAHICLEAPGDGKPVRRGSRWKWLRLPWRAR